MSRWILAAAVAALAAAAPCGAQAARHDVHAGSLDAAVDDRGAIVSLRDARTHRDLLSSTIAGLFSLELTVDGKSVTLAPSDAKAPAIQGGPSNTDPIVLTYPNLGGRGVDVTCTAAPSPADGLLHWRLAARFPYGMVLESVRFPIVVLKTRQEGLWDNWVMGSTKGGVYTMPSQWPIGRTAAATQPGSLAAGFACYYDGVVGFYTAAHDPRGCPKTVAATHVAGGIYVQWLHPCHAMREWSTPFDTVMGAFHPTPVQAADWRDAADIYKRWAVKQPWCVRTLAKRTDLPEWLRQGPAMVRFHRDWLADPASVDRWMASYWRANFPGIPLIAAYWGWEKVETWITPDYFPAFPSDRAFIDLARRMRALGAHTFLWPSGYHYTLTFDKRADGSFAWDDRARFDATARPHAVVGSDGQTLIGDRSWLRGGQTATMCPGDPWTRSWFDAIAAGCARRGAELVQVDQVVGGSFPPCYSTAHGHPPGPGPWMTDVFHQQLRSMLAAMNKTQPGAVVCFEEPNEWFLQHAGVQDYRDLEVLGQEGVEPASVFNYLYHEYVPTFQSNPQAGNKLHTAWCIVTGQIPHFVPSRLVGPGTALAGGGFEEWRGEAPEGWDKVAGYQGEVWTGSAARDTVERHGGAASLRLRNTETGQTVQVSQNVAIGGGFRVGGTYRLSVWVKSGGAAAGNALMLGTFADGLRATWSGGIAVPAQAGDWTRCEATFTVPHDSRMLRIMLHLRGPGTVWIDDLALEEVRPDGRFVEAARPLKPDDHEMMRQWVALYHGRGRPYLALGRTLHPPALVTATQTVAGCVWPAILHGAYAAPDGSQAVVLVNGTDGPQTGTLVWQGRSIPLTMKAWEVRLVR